MRLLLIILIANFLNAYSLEKVKEGRDIIDSLKSSIYKDIKPDIDNYKEEFKNYYLKEVDARAKDPAKFIHDRAIIFMDLDFDGEDELLFTTEGISPSAYMLKEHIYVVKGSKIVSKLHIETLSYICIIKNECYFKSLRFYEYPNEGRGYNDNVMAVFTLF